MTDLTDQEVLCAIAYQLRRIADAAEAREAREVKRDADERARFEAHDRRAEEHMALIRQESEQHAALVQMQGRIADSVAPVEPGEPPRSPAEIIRLVGDDRPEPA